MIARNLEARVKSAEEIEAKLIAKIKQLSTREQEELCQKLIDRSK